MLTCTNASGQYPLWDSVGTGFEYELRMFYVDSLTDRLYTSTSSAYTMNGSPIYGVASWDGTKWDSLGGGLEPLGPWGSNSIGQFALAAERFENKLYFGGNFISAGLKPIKWIATWDGSSWDSLPVSPNYVVFDLEVYHGKLYACGGFTSIGGNSSIHYVSRWNGSSWEQVGDILDIIANSSPQFYEFCIYEDELYVAGSFDDTNNIPCHIARWNDTSWNYVGGGIQEGGVSHVQALTVYNDELWIGGWFSAAATGTSNYLTRWDGTQFKSIGGAGFDGQVRSLHVHNNKLYAGGTFWNVNGIPATSIAVFDGQDWCSLGNDLNNAGILCMATYHDSLIIGGGIAPIAGDTTNNIAMWIGGNYVDSCKDANIGFEENEVIQKQAISIYPNPNSGIFNLQFGNNISSALIRIYDNLGKLILVESRRNVFANIPIPLELQGSAPGLYLVAVETEDGILTSKILVK